MGETFYRKFAVVLKAKTTYSTVAPMQSISSSAPLKLIRLDILHLDTCIGGCQYLLALTDHFLRFVQVYVTTNKSAKIAADFLYNDFMFRYRIPGKILHDQGEEFENSLFAQLNKLCGIKRSRTTPYHPLANG